MQKFLSAITLTNSKAKSIKRATSSILKLLQLVKLPVVAKAAVLADIREALSSHSDEELELMVGRERMKSL